jgi:hypothetical protein
MSGFVKIYRDAMSHEVFEDPWLWKLFTWCILKANFKPGRFRGEIIPRGAFAAGRSRASAELHVHPSRFYRGLERLRKLGCIELKSNRDWTLVTVCNYTSYQSEDYEDRAPTERRPSADRAPTEQQPNSDRTQEKEPKESKEGKKGKEGKKIPEVVSLPDQLPDFIDTPGMRAALETWISYKAERGDAYKPRGMQALVSRVDRLSRIHGLQKIIDAMERAMASGWQGWEQKDTFAAGQSVNGHADPRGNLATRARMLLQMEAEDGDEG